MPRFSASARSGVAVLAVTLLAGACGPTGVATPSALATVAATPTAAPVTTPTAAPAASPTIQPASPPRFAGAPLGPGEYVVEIAGVSTSFTIPDASWVGGDFLPDGIFIGRDGLQGGLSITYFDGKVFKDTCSGDGTSTMKRSAAAFIGAIAANKALHASAPVTTTFAGGPAMEVDVTADAQPGCGDGRIWLWVLPTVGDFHLNAGEAARFIAVDVGDRTWVAVVETFPGADQAALVASTAPIVDSFAIR